MGGGLGGITGQSDEDSTVRDTGQLMGMGDTSLVSRIGWNRSPGVGSGLWPVLQDTVGLS